MPGTSRFSASLALCHYRQIEHALLRVPRRRSVSGWAGAVIDYMKKKKDKEQSTTHRCALSSSLSGEREKEKQEIVREKENLGIQSARTLSLSFQLRHRLCLENKAWILLSFVFFFPSSPLVCSERCRMLCVMAFGEMQSMTMTISVDGILPIPNRSLSMSSIHRSASLRFKADSIEQKG